MTDSDRARIERAGWTWSNEMDRWMLLDGHHVRAEVFEFCDYWYAWLAGRECGTYRDPLTFILAASRALGVEIKPPPAPAAWPGRSSL